jgi:hypothetical protein
MKNNSVLNLDRYSKGNTKVNITSLGKVEFKYVSIGDLINFLKYSDEGGSDRDYVVKVLKNQLMSSEFQASGLDKIGDDELKKIASAFIKNESSTFKYIEYTDNLFSDFKKAIPLGFKKDIESFANLNSEMISSIQNIAKSFTENRVKLFSIAESMQSVFKQASEIHKNLFPVLNIGKTISEAISSSTKWFENIEKAGLTPNMGDKRSISKIKRYTSLLKMGYVVFWVPRDLIVDQLVNSSKEPERKSILIKNRKEISEDCVTVVNSVEKKHLKDYKLHILEAISSLEQGNYRAAQSTASVCFDALLNEVIDTTSISNRHQFMPKVKDGYSKLKNIDQIPAHVIYAGLQSNLIEYSLREFDRLNQTKMPRKYTRHPSIHSVSSRQFSEFNAIQVVMIVCSLLKTTDVLGRGWLSKIAAYC